MKTDLETMAAMLDKAKVEYNRSADPHGNPDIVIWRGLTSESINFRGHTNRGVKPRPTAV